MLTLASTGHASLVIELSSRETAAISAHMRYLGWRSGSGASCGCGLVVEKADGVDEGVRLRCEVIAEAPGRGQHLNQHGAVRYLDI